MYSVHFTACRLLGYEIITVNSQPDIVELIQIYDVIALSHQPHRQISQRTKLHRGSINESMHDWADLTDETEVFHR